MMWILIVENYMENKIYRMEILRDELVCSGKGLKYFEIN